MSSTLAGVAAAGESTRADLSGDRTFHGTYAFEADDRTALGTLKITKAGKKGYDVVWIWADDEMHAERGLAIERGKRLAVAYAYGGSWTGDDVKKGYPEVLTAP